MTIEFALSILAQVDPGATNPTSAATVNSIFDFLVKGGLLMIPIGACSLIALTVIVERMASLRRSRIIPPGFLEGIKAVIGPDGGNRSEGLEYCSKHSQPVARIFETAIRRMDESEEVLERNIEQAGQREILKLRKYLRVLAVIASIAPLLGLLGTIFGMIAAFQTVAASGEALGRTESLAKGIYEALITTAAGLIVAIPTMIAYHAFVAKIERWVGEMDAMTVEFIETFHRTRVNKPAPTSDNGKASPGTRPAPPADAELEVNAMPATV